ncbi:hypothetical protein N658DRAFT_475772 [Parathielavia hyrcaniae]|uniref:Uncharacterized protein n=1 Tax=Parathielavia hyrcaniae TaxID=113614 RepID=A0AAN6Q166_9PEZI|nr:hypothetical protein N658DRAFT_475772 [Parathielavia hyrcaniae]
MYNNHNERGIRSPNAQPTTGAGPATGHGLQGPGGGLTYGQSPCTGPAPTTAGHHRHDVLNKLDPRVDSTHDSQPMPPPQSAHSSVREGTYGPHSSRLANALDPRVDSGLDSNRAAGQGAGGGLAGGPAPPPTAHAQAPGRGMMHAEYGAPAESTYGPHSSRAGNRLDPRVDSDLDRHVGLGATHAPGGGGHSTVGAGPGLSAPQNTTSGPWKSDTMNRLDPRVDSTTGAWKGGSGSRGRY